MDQSKTTLWYEDLESRRQPSLYYLSSEEDPAGPHLICDWNGPPTSYDEFDLDIMSKMIDLKPVSNKTTDSSTQNRLVVDMIEDVSQPIAPKTNSSYTQLTEDDGSRLDFLTVPPIVNSLLKRIMRNHAASSRPRPIPEEDSLAGNISTPDLVTTKKRSRVKEEASVPRASQK